MSSFLKITKIEFKLYFREFMSVFFAIIFPIMMLAIFGSIYGNDPTEFFDGHGAVDVLVPSYICMIIAVNGLMSLPLSISDYRSKKILKRFKATPLNPRDILLSQYVVMFVMTIVGTAIMILFGKIVFNLHFLGSFIPTLLAFVLISISMFSIGLLIAGVSPNGKVANVLAYIIYFPMLFLSGATLPLEMMPAGVLRVSNLLPLTYAVKLLQGVWLGESLGSHLGNIAVLGGVFVVLTGLAIALFKWE